MSKGPSEKPTADGAERITEEQAPEVDAWGIPMDELLNKIDSAERAAEAAPAEPPEEPEDTEEESSESEEEPSEPVVAAKETAAEDETPEETNGVPTEVEELRAMVEAQQAEAKHFESLLGSQSGMKGHFEKKLKAQEEEIAELRRQLQAGGEPDLDTQQERPPSRPTAQPQRTPDPRDTYIVAKAANDAFNTFVSNHPEAFGKNETTGEPQIDPAFAEAIRPAVSRIQETMVNESNPLYAAEEVSRLLNGAWAKADLVRKRERLAEIQRRRAEQGKTLKEKKRAAASASPGAGKKPAKKALDPWKMPLDELEKVAKEAAGEA